ncbi:hypothetical protein MKW98_008106, partial [Papaver atlanticum]
MSIARIEISVSQWVGHFGHFRQDLHLLRSCLELLRNEGVKNVITISFNTYRNIKTRASLEQRFNLRNPGNRSTSSRRRICLTPPYSPSSPSSSSSSHPIGLGRALYSHPI